MKGISLLLVFTVLCLGANATPDAIARVFGTTNGPTIMGLVSFNINATTNNYDVAYNISGLAASSPHGVHIHIYGDITATDGSAAGSHFNPYNMNHACPYNDSRHVGDLGNIFADDSGLAVGVMYNITLISFATGSTASCIGRGFVIHQLVDDCVSQPTGNSGTRYAQGVIGIALNAASTVGSSASSAVYIARIDPTIGNSAKGIVYFQQSPTNASRVQIYADLANVTATGVLHGFHVHQYGDYTDNVGGLSAGGHYNPLGYLHALPSENATRHSGDFGNLCVDSFGVVKQLIEVDNVALTSIIGRAVVLHQLIDSGQAAQPTGNAGARIGMGIVGVSNTAFPTPVVPDSCASLMSSSSGSTSSTGSSSGSSSGRSSSSSTGNMAVRSESLSLASVGAALLFAMVAYARI